MRWSWKIGTFWGISVFVHATFLLLLAWVLFSSLAAGQNLLAAVAGVAFILLLFLCVVLHEYGHAITARRFGISTRDITLYPIGGVARLERIPRNPGQEFAVAIAGPLVNLVIAGILYIALVAANAVAGVGSLFRVGDGNLPSTLMWVNLMLAVFNLAPAFPMDGGRILRAILATHMDYGRATSIAASVGQALAILLGFTGLFYSNNPFLILIAFFIYVGAGQEASMVKAELAFQGVPVGGAMMTQFVVLSPSDPLSRAVDEMLAGSQHDFFVMEGNDVSGLLTRTALIGALGSRGPDVPVSEVMRQAPAGVPPSASLEATFQRMREEDLPVLPVLDSSGLVGMISLENIGEFLMVRQAVDQLERQSDTTAPPRPPADDTAGFNRRGFRRWWRFRSRRVES